MQRFKKYIMKVSNTDSRGQPVIFGKRYGFPNPRTHGKFNYRANGTLSVAARHRAKSASFLLMVDEGWVCHAHKAFEPRRALAGARAYRLAAVAAGFRLPS
jgi:hypothetical protein